MTQQYQQLLIYIIKCTCATLLVFTINSFINYPNIGWALLSVILVLSSEEDDVLRTAVNRVKASAIGASIAIILLFLTGFPSMWTITLSVITTLIVSHFLRLDASTRTALATTVIIMLHEPGTHLWSTATERVAAVFAGGALGLVITFVFHFIYKRIVRQKKQVLDEEQISPLLLKEVRKVLQESDSESNYSGGLPSRSGDSTGL